MQSGELLRRADVAMYVAKQSPEGAIEFFDPTEEERSARHASLVRDLRVAIDEDVLTVHYQPKADAQNGRVVGVEALVRWQHPKLGSIPPDEFVGLAEYSGLIGPLTNLVLRHALRQCQQWQVAGLSVHVAVNLSARSLRESDLADSISGFLDAATLATLSVGTAEETQVFSFVIDPGALPPGPHVLAVEVHQSAADSSDLTFDAGLVLTVPAAP